MFDLIYFCVILISWLMFGSLATEMDCDENCGDFHRICPAVKNQTFYDDYSAKHSSGQLGIFSNSPLPPPPDCDNGFYQTACPRSCEICISCETTLLEKAGLQNSNGDTNEQTAVKLKLTYDIHDEGYNGIYPLRRTVDGDYSKAYLSQTEDKPSVQYFFENEYSVGKVNYTAHKATIERQKNVEVSVCDDNGCAPCEAFVETSETTLETFCDNKQGNRIKFQEPDDTFLNIREIEVWGTEIY